MGKSLEVIFEGSRSKCLRCAHAIRAGNSSVDCKASPGLSLPYVTSKCPNGWWDNSEPVKYVPTQPVLPVDYYTYVCWGKQLEWPVDVWQMFEKFPLIDGKFRVPRALYDSVAHRRTIDDE